MAKTNWYSEIPYKVEQNGNMGICVTPCPFYSPMSDGCTINIGGAVCQLCMHNIGMDYENHIVFCTNPKNLE